jgi:hypothetical protein
MAATRMSDAELRRLYERLLARRAQTEQRPPDIAPETVQALAEGSFVGGNRVELLDQVLSHAVTEQEFHLFQQLAAARQVTARRLPLLGLAAAATLVVGLGIVWQLGRPGSPEPVRGGESAFALVAPEEGTTLRPGVRFVWRSAPGAVSYRFELIDAEGSVVFSHTTADTSVALPLTAPLDSSASHQAWVMAILGDGTEERTPPRTW